MTSERQHFIRELRSEIMQLQVCHSRLEVWDESPRGNDCKPIRQRCKVFKEIWERRRTLCTIGMARKMGSPRHVPNNPRRICEGSELACVQTPASPGGKAREECEKNSLYTDAHFFVFFSVVVEVILRHTFDAQRDRRRQRLHNG